MSAQVDEERRLEVLHAYAYGRGWPMPPSSHASAATNLPLDVVEIDGDFVRDPSTSRFDQLVVQSVVQVARELRCVTVAEYVEDAETVELLASYGADRVQGFHLGRPQPVERLLAASDRR